MQTVPQITSVRELKGSTSAVIERTEKGPVFLMNRTAPRVVLVSPNEWDATAKELQAMKARISELEVSKLQIRELRTNLQPYSYLLH